MLHMVARIDYNNKVHCNNHKFIPQITRSRLYIPCFFNLCILMERNSWSFSTTKSSSSCDI